MRNARFTSLVLSTLFLASLAANAASVETYKWKDDQGRVHYTQQPPNGRPYEVIKQRVPERDMPTAAPTTTEKKTDLDKQKEIVKGDIDRNKRNCEIAQQNRESLMHAAKISVKDENGTERHLSDDERKERLKATDQQIETYCKK